MRNRSLVVAGLGTLLAVAVLWPVSLVGQGAKPYSPPRTPDGHPDLQGTYDLATLTPLDRPALVLAHSPDHVRGLPPARVLLALCGHTHGGQVRLPLIGAPWIPVQAPLPRYAGAMSLDGVPTYVSRGIGATIPVRLGAVPEATLIEIV